MKLTKEQILDAVHKACVSKGKNKGMLKKNCPPSYTLEAAAWQGLQDNPYKMSVGMIMFFDDEQRELFDFLTNNKIVGLDQDRKALKEMGAW